MKILKKIEIKNFRGIKNIKFSPKSINIIVGANNSGKTAILEAILLFSSFPNNFKVSESNVLEYLFEKYGDYLHNVNSKDLEIKGKLTNRTYRLNIKSIKGLKSDYEMNELINKHYLKKLSEFEDSLPKNILFSFMIDRNEKITGEFGDKDYSLIKKHFLSAVNKSIYDTNKYIISVYNNQEKVKLLCSYIGDDIGNIFAEELKSLNIVGKDLHMFSFLFSKMINKCDTIVEFNARGFKKYPILFKFNNNIMNITEMGIEELHDTIIEKKMDKDFDSIIGFIKEKINYIEDIRRTEEEIYVKVSGNYMPLSTMGDGFKELLRLSFILALAKGGTVLLEEPETSLHPGFLDIIAETIVKSSEHTQIFLTTHNLELLYKILEKSAELEKIDELDVIRMYRKRYKPEKVFIESISGNDAMERIDKIGEDLRI